MLRLALFYAAAGSSGEVFCCSSIAHYPKSFGDDLKYIEKTPNPQNNPANIE